MNKSRTVAAALGGTATAAAAYWTAMSSYSQTLGPFPYRASTGEQRIALTFDDGPKRAVHLPGRRRPLPPRRALHLLPGRALHPAAPQVTPNLAAAGHTIGNHSLSHEMNRCLRRADLTTRWAPTSASWSAGSGAAQRCTDPLAAAHTRPVPDPRQPPAQRRLGRVLPRRRVRATISGSIACRGLAKARPGVILIFHDGFDGGGSNRANTVAVVRLVLDGLAQNGYTFATVDQLLGIKPYQDTSEFTPLPEPS